MNILEVLQQQRNGAALVEAQQKFQDLVKACEVTGKKGKFSITLDIIPAEKEVVVVRDDITTKVPRPNVSTTSFYTDEQGALHRKNPRQPEFPEVERIVSALPAVNE